jgi:hypothetical protein
MRKEYAVEVRYDDKFDRQIDVYSSLEKAEETANSLDLEPGEEADIVCIEYDDNESEIAAYSVA